MKLSKVLLAGLTALSFGTLMSVAQAAPLTVGTTSAFYINTAGNNNRIYVVQGNSVINSFSPTRAGGNEEAVLAVSGGVISTRSYTIDNSTALTSGQYTLTGTAIGSSYAGRLGTPGVTGAVYDGTTNGAFNFAIEQGNSINSNRIIRYDLNWQNPVALFTTVTSNNGQNGGVAYDPLSNTLWTSGYASSMIYQYSMSGTVLSSFNMGHNATGALGFDSADGTLWLAHGSGNNFEQWSTSGVRLQQGSFIGLNNGGVYAADFAYAAQPQSGVPAPGALALLALGLLGLGAFRRRKAA